MPDEIKPVKQNPDYPLRVFPVGDDDMLIEAMKPGKRFGCFDYIAFKVSAIEYISSFEEENAQIVLNSGVAIPVRMDARELKRAIYQPPAKRDDVLDLTAITGEAVNIIWAENMPLKTGMQMADGSYYVGLHEGQHWFTAAADWCDANGQKVTGSLTKAFEAAAACRGHGKDDWKLPGLDLMKKMQNAQELFPLFNNSAGFYWSSTLRQEDPVGTGWLLDMKTGKQDWFGKEYSAAARFVRSMPR